MMSVDPQPEVSEPSTVAHAAACGPMTVYYDGSCPICRAEIAHYRTQEGSQSIAFVDVSNGDADLGPGLDTQQAMARFHVRRPDASLASGAEAMATLWQQLPNWRGVGNFAARPMILPILEAGYRLSLWIRPPISAIARRVLRSNKNR